MIDRLDALVLGIRAVVTQYHLTDALFCFIENMLILHIMEKLRPESSHACVFLQEAFRLDMHEAHRSGGLLSEQPFSSI